MKTWLEMNPESLSVYIYRRQDDGSIQIAHDVTFEWFGIVELGVNPPSFVLEKDEYEPIS